MGQLRGRGFFDELRRDAEPHFAALRVHPFVRAIGAGTLSETQRTAYLRQDYLYLGTFAQVLALAIVRAQDLDTERYLTQLLKLTRGEEMALHRRTCAELGIDPATLEATRPTLVTTAYASFLLRCCHEGDLADILASLLPCEVVYYELACHLAGDGPLPDDAYCRSWIEIYAEDAFRAGAQWMIDRLEDAAETASEARRTRWRELYETSIRFERLFFEASWTGADWPQKEDS